MPNLKTIIVDATCLLLLFVVVTIWLWSVDKKNKLSKCWTYKRLLECNVHVYERRDVIDNKYVILDFFCGEQETHFVVREEMIAKCENAICEEIAIRFGLEVVK